MSAAEEPSAAASRRTWRDNPWWIPPFLGAVPDIDPAHVKLLGLVSLALFFEQYDQSMLTSALKYIADDLRLAEGDLGGYLGLIRLGALPAFLVVPFADRFGRRRLFLAAMLGMSFSTFLTAFSQTVAQFVACQMMSRTFMVACAAVAVVIVTEEFPAKHRGWGIGMLGALAACGHGLGAGLFATIEILPYGWRTLYIVGVVPLLLLPLFRREVRETGRFERHRESTASGRVPGLGLIGDWLAPLSKFARAYPLRVVGIALVAGLASAGQVSVFQFSGYFALNVHGWAPGQYSLMVVLAGGVGIIGNVAAGRAGDRVGRRGVGFFFLGAFPLFAWIFYFGPSWGLPLAFSGFVFCATAGQVITRALSTELFPTSQRGTSAGWVALVETLGAAAGLGVLGLGTHQPGDIARMACLLALAGLVGGLSLFLLPETGSRELEAISQEAV